MRYFYLILALTALLYSLSALSADRIKIGVIDTGIDLRIIPKEAVCDQYDFTGTGYEDHIGHGSVVSGILLGHLDTKRYCIVSYKWIDSRLKGKINSVVSALQTAIKDNVRYLNMSMDGTEDSEIEKGLIYRLLKSGVIVSVAAGNRGLDLSEKCLSFPACYGFQNRFYVVGALDPEGYIARYSNKNGPVNAYDYGILCYKGNCIQGTSAASPNFLGRLIKKESRK